MFSEPRQPRTLTEIKIGLGSLALSPSLLTAAHHLSATNTIINTDRGGDPAFNNKL